MREGKIMQKIQKIVVGAVIFDKDKILALQRSKNEEFLPNLWELPGGKVEFGESVDSALHREVKEETGLSVNITGPVSTFHYITEKPDQKKHTVQISFITDRSCRSKVITSEEHDSYAWISKEQVENYKFSEETRKVILKAFSKRQKQ